MNYTTLFEYLTTHPGVRKLNSVFKDPLSSKKKQLIPTSRITWNLIINAENS